VQDLEKRDHRVHDGHVTHQDGGRAPAQVPEQQRNRDRAERDAGIEDGVQDREGRSRRRENRHARREAESKRNDEVPARLEISSAIH